MKIIALCAMLILCNGCKQEQLRIGEKAPRLAVYDLQSQPVQLDRWKGKNIYLIFWSAGCGGCMAEMVVLDKLSKMYADQIIVVAINIDPQQVDIQPVLLQWQINYPVVRDQLGVTQERYQVLGTPTAFSIDVNGNIIDYYQGARNEKALLLLFQQWASDM